MVIIWLLKKKPSGGLAVMISKELRSDRSQLFAGCNERVAKVETLQKIIEQMSDERSNQSG